MFSLSLSCSTSLMFSIRGSIRTIIQFHLIQFLALCWFMYVRLDHIILIYAIKPYTNNARISMHRNMGWIESPVNDFAQANKQRACFYRKNESIWLNHSSKHSFVSNSMYTLAIYTLEILNVFAAMQKSIEKYTWLKNTSSVTDEWRRRERENDEKVFV